MPVRAEADATDVQVSVLGEGAILEMGNRASSLDIKDLGRAIAASSDKSPIQAEPNAAHNTLVGQIVNQIHVEHASRAGVEYGEPVGAFLLQVVR